MSAYEYRKGYDAKSLHGLPERKAVSSPGLGGYTAIPVADSRNTLCGILTITHQTEKNGLPGEVYAPTITEKGGKHLNGIKDRRDPMCTLV